ncbi:MAG: asparagine synthase (glutamine-hydrolyzing) [Nitrospira sp.]|nr:asparagine synthase (glutamine-hydrolyzing) [Nitrospira sp.]
MCGILGWCGRHRPGDGQRFGAALDLLAHRGPDDRGVFEEQGVLLGHRRLSIIDLSRGGHQPMKDEASGAVIVFNGEIYNYRELRGQLESLGLVFRTQSDTEVLLQAYLKWGSSVLKKLNGMWSFAIWQPRHRKLFVARDRFGVKPFYFTLRHDRFAFASEPKSLRALFPELQRPDEVALYRFLSDGFLYTEGNSFYHGIHTLAPAHYGEYTDQNGQFKVTRYWDYPETGTASNRSSQDAMKEFAGLFEDAVMLRMRSDVPVGVTLSGGLDSTAVLAAAMRHTPRKMVCFTSVYGGTQRGEAEWAGLAAAPYGIVPVEVEAPKGAWLDTLRQIAWHMDGPGYSPAVYPLWYVMREARQRGVLVLMEGQGADEALGGYPQYAVIAFLGMVKQLTAAEGWGSVVRAWRRLCATFTPRWVVLWVLRELFPWLVAFNRRRAGAYMVLADDFRHAVEKRLAESGSGHDEPRGPTADPVTRRLLRDHSRNILPGLLHYGDAISMAHGVESRLPFMDVRLVEWMFSRHDAVKVLEGETKWILREYLRSAGQNSIADRKDKQGYPTPIEYWLGEDDGAVVREILLGPNGKVTRFCDARRIETLLKHHLAGRSGVGNHLYRLISTELWLQQCV